MTARAKWTVLLGAGVLLSVAGVIIGFIGISQYGVDCGSAFSPASFDSGFTLISRFDANVNTSQCAAVTATAATWAWLLIIAGVLSIAIGGFGAAGYQFGQMNTAADAVRGVEDAPDA